MSLVKKMVIVDVFKFISDHPYSSLFAVASPLIIPPQYHSVFAQIILTLGTQLTMFIFERLRKKAKIRKLRKDYDQSFDDYLKDKDPTEKR